MNKLTKTLISIGILFFLLVSTISFASALLIGSVTMDATEIKPGDIITVQITLENNAEEDISDVSALLDITNLPFAPVDTGSEFGIDEIRAEKNKIARFKLIVLENAKSEVYKIPVKLTYADESNKTQTKNSLISIRVTSKPIIDIISDENLLLSNQNNEVNIRIVNKGISDIKFLEIEGITSANTKILSPSKIYIGDLESDDFDTVTYKIFFENDKNIQFPILVKYQDSLNNEYTETFSVPLRVYSRDEAISLGLIERSYTLEITLLIVALVLLIVFYRSWRKAKKKTKKFE